MLTRTDFVASSERYTVKEVAMIVEHLHML